LSFINVCLVLSSVEDFQSTKIPRHKYTNLLHLDVKSSLNDNMECRLSCAVWQIKWRLFEPTKTTCGEQGWRSGEGTPSHFCGQGLISAVCCMLALALLQESFFRFSGFPPSTKTNFSKFQFDQDRGPAWKPYKADVAFSLNIVIYFT